jgi:tetratricopeptide (TPR) repeat protein
VEGLSAPSSVLRICVLPFQGVSGKEEPWILIGVPYIISCSLSRIPSIRVLDREEASTIYHKISESGLKISEIQADIIIMGFVSSGRNLVVDIGVVDNRGRKEPYSIKRERRKEEFLQLAEELVDRITEWAGIPKGKRERTDPTALEEFLKGMALWISDKAEEAMPKLESALKRDPSLWRAAALMARICCSLGDVEKAEELLESQVVRNEGEPELWLELGAFYHGKEDFEKAVRAYRKALELRPDLVPAYLGLGVARRRLGDVDGAISDLRKGFQLDPRDREIGFNLATIYHLDKGMVEEAMAIYKELLAMDPRDPAVLHNLGLALMEKGEKDEAISKIREALSIEPDNPYIMTSLGVALSSVGKDEEALSMWEKALKIDEDFVPALLCLGNHYSSKGSYGEAERIFRRILEREPDAGPDIYMKLAMCIYLQGRKEEAAQELEGISKEMESPDLYNLLGMMYKEIGKVEKARDSYEKALILDPDNLIAKEAINELRSPIRGGGMEGKKAEEIGKGLFKVEYHPEPIEVRRGMEIPKPSGDSPFIHANMAMSYATFGFLEKAREEAEKALKMDPACWEARIALGNILLTSGDAEGALKEYRKALEQRPSDPTIYNNIGICLLRIGKYGDAIASLRKALAINPDMKEARLNLANALFDSGNFAEALSEYNAILKEDENLDALFNSALCLDALGRYEEALARLERYIDSGGEKRAGYNAIGNVFLKRKDYEKAIGFYKKALEDGAYEPAIANLAICYERLGMKEEMRKWWRRYLDLFPKGENAGLAKEKLERGEKR